MSETDETTAPPSDDDKLPPAVARLPVRDDPQHGRGIHHHQVAQLFGVKPSTLRQMRSDGELAEPDYKASNVPYYFPRTVAAAYRRRHPETILTLVDDETEAASISADQRHAGVKQGVNSMETALTVIAHSMKRADKRDDQVTQLTEAVNRLIRELEAERAENRRLREALEKRQISWRERLTGRLDSV